jgi:uncharacterized alkaline shock family protein YloU
MSKLKLKKLEEKLENCQIQWQQIINYGKTLPEFVQHTYWTSNKEILDNLSFEIKNIRIEINNLKNNL